MSRSMSQQIKQYSNPVHICAAARQRAEQSLTDSSISLTKLEKAFAVALRHRKDADIKLR